MNRSLLARVFLSPGERRLRAGWRLLLQLLILVVLAVVASVAVALAFRGLAEPGKPPEGIMLLSTAVTLLAITAAVYLGRRFLDRRSFVSLGIAWGHHAPRDVLVGVAIAGLQMGFIYLAESALGWLRFEGAAWQVESASTLAVGMLSALALFICVGWQEELQSRGYWLQNIADGLNQTWGVVLSSLMFALLHLGNPNASWVAVVALVGAGLYLAYAYVRTRQLWLSIGLHIGWNFFEGPVFGFPVSGLSTLQLIRHEVVGPEIWTGGAFGPEAGLVVLPALLLGVLLIWLYTSKRQARAFAKS